MNARLARVATLGLAGALALTLVSWLRPGRADRLEAPRTPTDAPGRAFAPRTPIHSAQDYSGGPGPSTGPYRTPPLPDPSPSPEPEPEGQGLMLTGTATWYDYHRGQAAAGPRLRRLLGDNWRGMTVVVIGPNGTEVRVRLTDACTCTPSRIIDLDRRDFGHLASPSRGVLKVVVYR